MKYLFILILSGCATIRPTTVAGRINQLEAKIKELEEEIYECRADEAICCSGPQDQEEKDELLDYD